MEDGRAGGSSAIGDGLVQSLSHVLLFSTPWTAALLVSLSLTIFRSLRKLISLS